MRNNLQPLKPYLQEKYLKISSIYIKKSRVCVEVSRWYFHYLFRFFFPPLSESEEEGGLFEFLLPTAATSLLSCVMRTDRNSLSLFYIFFFKENFFLVPPYQGREGTGSLDTTCNKCAACFLLTR